MKLSILVCTTTGRVGTFLPKIIRHLENISSDGVEILYLGDNKKRSVGTKRNDLINLAQGEYISFIDDDDMVSSDYCTLILKEIEHNPDVICFNAFRNFNGRKDRPVIYSALFKQDADKQHVYERIPNHLSVWRKDLCLPFQDRNFGEDSEWAIRMRQLIKTSRKIDKVLYQYWFDSRTTETQR